MLVKGSGLPQNFIEAFKWFNLAAGQGYQNAVKNRDLLAQQMTKEQIAEGQKRAAQFITEREPGL